LPTLAKKRRSRRMRSGGLVFLLVALLLASGLKGCATFRGLGEDIQHLGKKLEDKASR
jgi:predicted small secreted protein